MNEDIKKACQVMCEGGVILYPTDTIWGIGCDATNEEAVRRVYEIKQRADSKAMLVLVDTPVKVDFYVQDVPEIAWDLIDLADKPLTIIYSGARNLAPNLLDVFFDSEWYVILEGEKNADNSQLYLISSDTDKCFKADRDM